MITNFALSLSVEGIELLHRVPRGWRRIGRASVTSENLDAELANIREKAEAIEPGGLRTKLIIPLDQIKYTAIDSTRTTQDDIDEVLEGATPYGLNELVVDCERFGGRTHIAAVARETLQEAETFAAAHGFNPVAFVAVPEPFTFQKEVFFGPTTMMPNILGPDATVARDDVPVMIVGTRIKSRLLVFDLPQEVEEEAQKDDLAELLAPRPKKEEPAAVVEPDVSEQIADDPVPEVEIEVETEVEPKAEAQAEVAEDIAVAPEDSTPVEDPVPVQQVWVDHIPMEYHAPVVIAPVIEVVEPTAPLVPANPVFAKPALLDRVIAEYHPGKITKKKAPLTAIASAGSSKAPKLGIVAPVAGRVKPPVVAQNRNKAPLIATGLVASVLLLAGLVWSQRDATDVVTAPTPEPVAAVEAPTQTPAPAAPVENVTAVLEAGPDTPDLTIAGFGIADTDGGPLPVLAADTRPAVINLPEGLSVAEADALPIPALAPPAPPESETAQAAVGAPVLRGQVLSPAEANRIYAATGVWQRAPRFLDVPTGPIPLDFSAPATTTPPDRIAQPEVPAFDTLDTDLSFISPANPPAPEVTFPLDDNGFILATPEGTVTPEGAIVIAGLPDLSITPRPRPVLTDADLNRMALLAPAPEGVIIIAGRPDPLPPLRPANAQLPEITQAPAEETADLEPPTAPQLTPGSVGIAALELQNSGAVALDPSVVEDGGIVDLRPQLRPQGLSPSVDPGTPDITVITDIIASIEVEDATLRFDNSTSLAVVLSRRPDTRPANFSNVVAAARARAATPPVAAAAPTPAPAPAPVIAAAPVPPQNFEPVPGGVARAATQEDAIRLREINLIGVYGRPNARRALVRLTNGRYVRVEVGSALDGGQVTAIGDNALNYVKRGRTFAIQLP